MITTKIAEKEKKIRAKLRIKEVIGKNGCCTYYPQYKNWLGWHVFINWHLYNDLIIYEFYTLEDAKDFIDEYVNRKLRSKKIMK